MNSEFLFIKTPANMQSSSYNLEKRGSSPI